MIKLTINDGPKVYWKENFNTHAEANKWLAEEKLRPYWKKSFTATMEDTGPEDAARAEQDRLRLEAERAAKLLKINELKSTKGSQRSVVEINALLDKIIETLYG